MSDEAERLRDAIKEAVHWPNPPTPLARDFCRVVVAELGITEETTYAIFRAWSDAEVVGDQVELKKARHALSTLLEVAGA